MIFTKKNLEFRNNLEYDEISHANALQKGIPSFVTNGLEYLENTKEITSGTFSNNGTFGQLGLSGEKEILEVSESGVEYIIIKSTLNSENSESQIIVSTENLETDTFFEGNIKYFTIYKLNNGLIEEDYRISRIIKSNKLENLGDGKLQSNVNGFKSNIINFEVFSGEKRVATLTELGYNDSDYDGKNLDTIIYGIRELTNATYPIIIYQYISNTLPNLIGALVDRGTISNGYLKLEFPNIHGSIKSEMKYINTSGTTFNFSVGYANAPADPTNIEDYAFVKPINGKWVFFEGTAFLKTGQNINLIPCPWQYLEKFKNHNYIFSGFDDATDLAVDADFKNVRITDEKIGVVEPRFSLRIEEIGVNSTTTVIKRFKTLKTNVIEGSSADDTYTRQAVLRQLVGEGSAIVETDFAPQMEKISTFENKLNDEMKKVYKEMKKGDFKNVAKLSAFLNPDLKIEGEK